MLKRRQQDILHALGENSTLAPDRPTQTLIPDIEVTPAMIEAGVRVLWESGALEVAMLGADQGLVQEIFVAMSRASGERS
jgi:hypothetical protein